MPKKIIAGVLTALIIITALGYTAYTFYKKDGVNPQADYSLIDMHGNPVDETTNLGKKQIVFFGFTYCPEVCPTALLEMTRAFDKIEDPDEWVGVLVTIDPKRDTAENLKEYITGNFHKNITGYTGTEAGIKEMADAFQARYNISEETKNNPEFYLMEHTAFVYYLNTDGSLSSVSLYNAGLGDMLKRMRAVK